LEFRRVLIQSCSSLVESYGRSTLNVGILVNSKLLSTVAEKRDDPQYDSVSDERPEWLVIDRLRICRLSNRQTEKEDEGRKCHHNRPGTESFRMQSDSTVVDR